MSDEQTGWPSQAAAEEPSYLLGAVQPQDNDFPEQTEAVVEAGLPETEEAFIRRRDGAIQDWTEAKSSLAEYKDKEAEARLRVTNACFPTPKKGTQRYELAAGWKLKLVYGWNFTLGMKGKVDDQGLEITVFDQVAALEKSIADLGPEAALLVERLIKWKPELSGTEYQTLARSDATDIEVRIKGLIDEILTVTPASPQLTLEEPKKPK